MVADLFKTTIGGLDELRRQLQAVPVTLRKKVLLSALRKAARVPLQVARQNVPIMSAEMAAKAPYRTAGLLKKQLMVRTSKASRQAGNVGVFINVKPAAGAKYKSSKSQDLLGAYTKRTKVRESQRGAKSKLDPYYWKFVEFGTKKMAARPFIQPAADALPRALTVFSDELANQVRKLNVKK